jgi:uncharacterized membrane protein
MKTIRPRKQMLILGCSMIFVSLLIFVGNLFLVPDYLTLRHSSGTVTKIEVADVLGDGLVITTVLAVFLLISARSIFRNRKALRDDKDAA